MKNLAEEPSLPALAVDLGDSAAALGEIEITDIPKKMGRKAKLTPELQARICEVLAAGCTRSAAASYAGISRDTFYKWLDKKGKAFVAFQEGVKEAEAKARVAIESKLAKLAVEGDRLALMFYLQNRYPDDWKNVSQVDVKHTGKVDHEHTVTDARQRITGRLDELAARRRAKEAAG